MANTYKLTINDIPKENLNLELTYNQKDESTQTLSINNTNYKCTLNKFSYKKAIYQPGEIHIELQVGKESNAAISFSEVKDIHNAFIGKFFQLQYTGKKSLNIAERYYTFDVKIEKQGSGKPLTVKIQAFDPLKFLALDKYCMAYTCKKLIKDILMNSAVWPNGIPETLTGKLSSAQSTMDEINKLKYEIYNLNEEIDSLQNQNQDTTEKKKELEQKTKDLQTKEEDAFIVTNTLFLTYTNNTDKTYTEFIQPYLVQYNESFLDFLVRVTNRCGEFFYYEGGKIHIGWEATDPITIQEYVSVKFPQEIRTAWADYAIADIHNDYTQGKNIINFAAPVVMRDSELAFDENLAKIPPKGEYTSWQDFALFPGCYFVNNISGALNSATLTEMIEFFIYNSSASLINSEVLSIDTNNTYEKNNFDSSKPYFNERKNGDDLHPFSTNDTNKSVKSMTAYCLDFYTNIRNGIESAERSRLQIELGDHYCEASLGSLIQFEGDTQQYIVVKIESQIDGQTGKLGLSGGETLSMEVIPYTEGETVYPPSAHVEPMRSAKAQRAIITHNQDPLKMNRVRVRYPWQGKTESADDLKASEDSTPWIRIALPMASNGSGFNFLPEVGDEAIINYENGNIEKPYVEGMLYSSGQTVPFSHKRNNARVLSSVNGHCIIFSDPGASTNAIKGLFPAWNTICSFIPTAKAPLNDDVRKAMGGIELTDEYGLYSISMSTEKRAISVDSPFGNVSINAFTGITISAPNGDIKIEGKNITLSAGNNIKIESGINKKTNYWPFSKNLLKEQGKESAKTLIKKTMNIDMKLIRTVMETFLRPIGGTMHIKSNRYLLLEAGKGKINIANRQVMKNFEIRDDVKSVIFANNPFSVKQYEPNVIYDSLNASITFIDDLFFNHRLANRTIFNKKTEYERPYSSLKGKDKNELKKFITNTKDILEYSQLVANAKKAKRPNNITLVNRESLEGNDQTKYNDYEELVNHFNTTAQDLYLTISNRFEEDIWNTLLATNRNIKEIIEQKKIKESIQKTYEPIYWEKHPTNDQVQINKEDKRLAVYNILNYLISRQEGSNVYLKIKLGKTPESFSNYNWVTFIDQTETINQFEESPLTEKMTFIWDAINTKDMLDQYVWDKLDDGKILFSDKDGEAFEFNDKQIQTHQSNLNQNDSKLEDIKTLLRGQ